MRLSVTSSYLAPRMKAHTEWCDMDSSKLEAFIANATLLASHLSHQCDKAATAQQASAQELQASALVIRNTIEEWKREMAEHARGAIRDILLEGLHGATRDIGEATARLKQAVDALQQEQTTFARRAHFLGWKSLGALVTACLLLIVATGYAAWHNLQRAERAEVDAEVLAALEDVTITSCSGQPCIKLEDGLRRWQKNDQYVLVDTRPRQTQGSGTGDAAAR